MQYHGPSNDRTNSLASAQSSATAGHAEEMKTIIGGMAGGLVGYWFRPSVPLLGQLPFEVVASRGQSLRGLDVVFSGIAEQSFNYIVVGVVIGCCAGFVLTRTTQTTGSN